MATANVSEGLQLQLTSKGMEYKEVILMEKQLYIPPSDEDEEGKEEQKQEMQINQEEIFEFTYQAMLRENCLQDLQALFLFGKDKIPMNLEFQLVENPSPEIMTQAQIKLINKKIFDTIQQSQQGANSIFTTQEIYEIAKGLDLELDSFMENVFKIKDRDMKKEIIQDI